LAPRIPIVLGLAVFCCGMFKLSGICVVTDEALKPGRSHEDIALAAVRGGAGSVQLRDKTATDREFYRAAAAIRKFAAEAGVPFVVNDRVHVAVAVGADAVHVGQSDMPVCAVRRVVGPDMIIGLSASSLEEALQAKADGADYIGFGPVFSTSTKLDAGPETGLELLERVCRESGLPVIAIGGIGLSGVGAVARTGAAGAAVVSAVVCAEDMEQATRELRERFRVHQD